MTYRFDKLLILDLDETLVYVSMFVLPRKPHFQVGIAHAWKRPGLDRFMAFCMEHFEVGIWTSATMEYAGDVIFHLDADPSKFAFIWTREHCTTETGPELYDRYWVKDLNRLLGRGYTPDHIIVLDDSPECWTGHHDNVVPIAKFHGDPNDRELERVLRVLEKLGSMPDTRKANR